MEFIYENPDIDQVLAKATELHLLHCKRLTKITAELPEGLDIDTRYVLLGNEYCLGIFVKVAGESALTLTQAVEDTPDNRKDMQDLLVWHFGGFNIPAYDHVNGLTRYPAKYSTNPLLRQAQDLRQTYGSALKLGIFKGDAQRPLGWTTLDDLDLQDIIEFLELGYVLKPID